MKTAALNKSRIGSLVAVVAGLLFVSSNDVNSAARYVVIDLGVLQQGEGSCALGLNNAGQVVGFGVVRQSGGSAYPRAFVWSDGTMRELGALGSDQASVARRINNNGSIVGWSEQVGVRTRAVLWQPYWEGWYINNLDTLGGSSSAALDLNEAGTVVGWSDLIGDVCKHGFLWSHGWMNDLGALPDETNSFAHAINSAEQTVGFASTGGTNATAHAIVWEWWEPTYLMPENARNSAEDINDAGLVVGYYTVTNGAGPTRHACVWALQDLSVIDLGVLPGDNASRAVAINAGGKVVGLSWSSADPFADPPFGLPQTGDFHPFIFDPDAGTVRSLNELIPANSGYTINWVGDINDQDWIAAAALVGTGSTQATHAVLLVPDPTIMRHPTNQQAEVGGTASFSVEVVGSEPLVYQWWKDNAPLTGATNSSLVLTNVQAADAGQYFVVVTNPYGAATSKVALLTINAMELDPAFAPHVNGDVYAFAVQSDGKIIVAGRFDSVAGHFVTNIARLNTNGTVDPDFDVAMPAETAEGYETHVNSLVVQPDGRIVLGGYFDSIAGQPRTNLGRVLPNGVLDSTFDPSVVGVDSWRVRINSMALQADGKLLIGGDFIEVGGVPRTNIARLNPDGSVDPEFSPAIGSAQVGNVYSIALQPDGKVIVGGDFNYVNEEYRPVLARLNGDGSLDVEFAPDISGGEWPVVQAIAVQDDSKVLIGGWFSVVNGEPRTNIARLNPDGSVDTAFIVGANDLVVTFAQQTDGKILFAGGFNFVNGIERCGIARVTREGLLDPNFSPILESFESAWPFVNALAVQSDGKILIGGDFDVANDNARTNIARLLNTVPAVENIHVEGSQIVWSRTGSCPEAWRTTVEYSVDGQIWHYLGAGARITNGWRFQITSLPPGSMLRARGYLAGGRCNGSAWFVETQAAPVLPIWLRIERHGPDVVLSWTGGRPPYQVQRTTELTASNYWENVADAVWTNTVVLPLGVSNAFFRVYCTGE